MQTLNEPALAAAAGAVAPVPASSAPVRVLEAPTPAQVPAAPASAQVLAAPAPAQVLAAPAPAQVLAAPAPAQVLIVDDHPILRHGIARLVEREGDFAVCAEAGSIDEALAVLQRHAVDLVVVDLSLEDRSGMDLIRSVRTRHPQARCLVLSMHDERLHAERALRAGARGYVMKQEATRKIVSALRCIREGRIYLGETVASEILSRLAGSSAGEPPDSAAPLAMLSDRELEVLRLIGRGLKTGDIARSLHRSVHTVEAHRANIKRKLGLKTAGDLARAAFTLEQGQPGCI